MANIITVKFKPDGDGDLKKAINAIATAQRNLNNSSETVAKTTKKVRAQSTKLNSTVLSLTARIGAQNKTWQDLGVSTKIVSQAMRGNQIAVEKLKIPTINLIQPQEF